MAVATPEQNAFRELIHQWVDDIRLAPGRARSWSPNMRHAYMEWLAEKHPGTERLFDRQCTDKWWWKAFHEEFPEFKRRGMKKLGSLPIYFTNYEVIPTRVVLGPNVNETCEHCGRNSTVRTLRPAPSVEELRNQILSAGAPAELVPGDKPGIEILKFGDPDFDAEIHQKLGRLKRRLASLCRVLGIEEVK